MSVIRTVFASGLALCLLAAPALAATAGAATIKAADGKPIGTAAFREGPVGVLMRVEASGLAPGWHAIHFHEKGDCSDAAFTAAGGHINHAPAKKPHGLLNADGPDMGDLPNLYVGADGKANAEVFSTFVSMEGSGGRPALLDADGSSLVIHASADDFLTQPIGGAGARVGCAVIKAAPEAR